jgi:iron complex transport system substrate-binding protein
MPHTTAVEAEPRRIVSLLASGTEILVALGLEDRLVAISHECDFPPRVLDRPRVSRPRFDPGGLSSGELDAAVRTALAEHGSVYALDDDALARLAPGLILAQAVCEVCAVPTLSVHEVVQERSMDARVLSLDAHTLDDILHSIVAVGEAAAVPERAARLVEQLRWRIDAVRARVAGAARPRVLALEWLDPPFVPGHWVPEMIDAAGGDNLAGDASRPSRQVAWADLANLDPDVLLLMPCGYDLAATRADAARHAALVAPLAPRAIAEGRAFIVDGSAYFNRSGPRVVDGLEILAGLLHADRCPPPSPEAAAVWAPDETAGT